MGLGGVAIAALPSVVHLQLTFSDRLGGGNNFSQNLGHTNKHLITKTL